ncbi:F-box/FBD/LRR-repeat protein At5g53840 [Linum grandiflorum]
MEGGGEIIQQEDRISKLPDEVIHEILACLRSSRQSAKLAILSKRWNHLWRSYPVFDFTLHEWPTRTMEEDLEKFLTAATKKFSVSQHVAAVRIKLNGYCESDNLLEKLLGFVARVTQEVRLILAWKVIPEGLFNDDHSRRLKVLKLRGVRFPSGSSVRFGASLQVLSLQYVDFPEENNEGDRILNSVIESASNCLETLELSSIDGIQRLQIRDCHRLKTLKAIGFSWGTFEISGAKSLEILHVDYLSEEQMDGMLTPDNVINVKVVHVAFTETTTNEALNKFISKFSRLELLELIRLPSIPKVKIDATNNKFLRAIYFDMEYYERGSRPEVLEIEAPWLSKLVLNIKDGNVGFPDILINKTASEPVVLQVLVRCRLFYHIDMYWDLLQPLLATLSRFHLTLEFFANKQQRCVKVSLSQHIADESLITTIDHVKFPPNLLTYWDAMDFMNIMFLYCRPKLLSFTEVEAGQNVLQLRYLWRFIDRNCKAVGRIRPNYHPKCAKLMKRVINDDGIEEDREIDLVSFLDDPKPCWIVFYWC